MAGARAARDAQEVSGSEINISMKIRELLVEAVYDPLVDAIIKQFPEQAEYVKGHVQWAKQALKNPDRVTWYLRLLRAELEDKLGPELLGVYRWQGIQQLGTVVSHFYGYNYAPIENYRFGKNTVSDVIDALAKFEDDWKKKNETERGVEPQEGDYRLLEFGGGYAWWFVNRAYCSDEGRSGKHCGNVVGQTNPDQRILSFRNGNNQVLLTFILEPDGSLGEMKAKNNQKPAEKYHPYIVKLLELNMIKGISSGGYAPHMNFSMFDLSEQQLEYFLHKKPILLETQIKFTPIEILKAPASIKNNPRLQEIAIQHRPGLQLLFGRTNTTKDWSRAVDEDPDLVVYAPHDMENFEKKLLNFMKPGMTGTGEKLLGAPASISRNFELLKKIIKVGDESTIGGISPNTKGYSELCELAVTQNSDALRYVPQELRTERMCLAAVTQNGWALRHVPQKLRTERMCLAAVTNDGGALAHVPQKLRTERMCLAAVTNYGWALEHVPQELRTERMCLAAVTQSGYVLRHVPNELRSEKMCLAAVTNDGSALRYVPDELRSEKMCLAAVTQNGWALGHVPQKLRTERMCLAAVTNDGSALRYVPDELRSEKMCLAAVTNDGSALRYVPDELEPIIKQKLGL